MLETQRYLPAVLIAILSLAACRHTEPGATTEALASGPAVLRTATDGQHLSLEAQPSARAARLLPQAARLRLVIAEPDRVGLVWLGDDARIQGRLHIQAAVGPRAAPGLIIELDEGDAETLRIDLRSEGGRLLGRAQTGGHSSSWRARIEPDGALVGERWSAPGPRADDAPALRVAASLRDDIEVLTQALASAHAFDPAPSCELGELLTLAELAIELSVRAWEGRGRSELPRLTPPELCPR